MLATWDCEMVIEMTWNGAIGHRWEWIDQESMENHLYYGRMRARVGWIPSASPLRCIEMKLTGKSTIYVGTNGFIWMKSNERYMCFWCDSKDKNKSEIDWIYTADNKPKVTSATDENITSCISSINSDIRTSTALSTKKQNFIKIAHKRSEWIQLRKKDSSNFTRELKKLKKWTG